MHVLNIVHRKFCKIQVVLNCFDIKCILRLEV